MNTFRAIIKQILLAAVIASIPLAAVAQDFDKGLAAYEAGDYPTALKEFRMLAEQGNAVAQNNLGAMYYYGLGQPIDLVEAARWFRLAADQGDADGQNNLGALHDTGLGVPKDHAEAVRLYRMAAQQGHAGGQFNLGLMYSRAEGVPLDYIAAYMWFTVSDANGMVWGREFRDALAKLMSPDRVAEAQRRAKVCMESNYKDCD